MTLTTANLSVIYMKCGGSSFVFTSENPEEKNKNYQGVSVDVSERNWRMVGGNPDGVPPPPSAHSFRSLFPKKKLKKRAKQKRRRPFDKSQSRARSIRRRHYFLIGLNRLKRDDVKKKQILSFLLVVAHFRMGGKRRIRRNKRASILKARRRRQTTTTHKKLQQRTTTFSSAQGQSSVLQTRAVRPSLSFFWPKKE